MRRREFITLLGGAAAAWPLPVRAQQPVIPVVAFLGMAPASANISRVEGLRSGLRELGYIEGRNLFIELRFADSPAQLPELATELTKRGVAIVVGSGNAATRAAHAATSRIPILFAAADDPVKLGFVASFNRPGGNITGLSLISGALGPKRIELLREIAPRATKIAILTNPNNPAQEFIRGEREAARSTGLQIIALDASTPAEIEQAFAAMTQQQAQALLVNADALFTGVYTGRIVKGAKPSDLPVQQTTKVELILNLKTARALGITVPLPLSGRADEVIE
jgi:putative ABC transport system substrate-binding protein